MANVLTRPCGGKAGDGGRGGHPVGVVGGFRGPRYLTEAQRQWNKEKDRATKREINATSSTKMPVPYQQYGFYMPRPQDVQYPTRGASWGTPKVTT
jgi:hypothetical protein